MSQNLWLFLLSVVGISLSGVMLPGPLTAATIAKGYSDRNAGAMIGIGHGIVEIPIIALIYFGFASYLENPTVRLVTGLSGGVLLVVMGLLIVITFRKPVEGAAVMPYSPLVTGIVMTGGNPYVFLWWATIGVTLITGAVAFGTLGLVLFTVVHLACDIAWDQVVSMTVFRTRHLWTPKIQKIVFSICALVLIGFGIWYGVSVLL